MKAIRIPQELKPSSLLWLDDLCQAAEDLRENCCQFDDTADLRLLEVWKKDAKDLLGRGNETGCAVILICLFDLYRKFGKLGHALECSEEAEQYLHWCDEIKHKHNHAIALYSLGLVHQLLGSEKDALDRYDDALSEFAQARELWIVEGSEKWRRQCEGASKWIESLREQLAQSRSLGQPPKKRKIAVPIVSRISAGYPSLIDEDFEEWEDVAASRAEKIHFGLKVQGDSMVGAGFRDGDRVLIEQRSDRPGKRGQIVAVIIEGVDTEATLKHFYDEGDHVRLEPANNSYPLIIIKPNALPEAAIRGRYRKSHPTRNLEIYSGVDFRIAGWERGKI